MTDTGAKLDNLLGDHLNAAFRDGDGAVVKLRDKVVRHVCGAAAKAANDDPADALAMLDRARRSGDPEAVIREAAAATSWPRAMTPDELADAKFPEPSWLLDGVLPSNGLSLLVSSPDGGKSTLTRTLAMAVAEGTHFLTHATRQGTGLVWRFRGGPRPHARPSPGNGLDAQTPYPFPSPIPAG